MLPRIFFLFIIFSLSLNAQVKDTIYENSKQKIIDIGLKAYFAKDTIELKKSAKHLLNFYRIKNDSMALAKHYHYRALFYRLKFISDSAYYYYHESKKTSIKLKDSLEVGRRLLSLANMQREAKDFIGSEISSVEALLYLEPGRHYGFVRNVYNNLGIISSEFNQIDRAIENYEKSLKFNSLSKKTKLKDRDYLYTINNLGLLYQDINKHGKAISYFKKGLSFENIKDSFPIQYALLLENLAASNFLSGNKKNVLEQYKEVLDIRVKQKEFYDLSTIHLNLADYYKSEGNIGLVDSHLNKAVYYAKTSHNNKSWLKALIYLSEIKKGEEAKLNFNQYLKLSDSLLQQERGLKNQFARIRFETGKKEKENAFLKSENQRNQDEIVRHKQQKIIGWLAALLAFVGLGFTITVFVFRRRKLLFQAQLQKAEAREQERKQIAKALHDEVAGDLRLLHRKLEKSNLLEEATKLNAVKDNVRNLSHQLSSVSFKKVGFKDQIINLVSDYFEMDFRIFVKGINDYDWEEVDSAIKRLLYICLRETIQNSKNHAEASKVEVTFSIHKKNVLLNVADNGVGFDTSSSKKGIGLQNLQERVEELQGSFAITSERGTGTETHIQIPLNV
ncbi:conserved exported hypothetical protein [Tenacibaculum litopenaei]|uniref:tetratricopeptide repeat-containing sensor histidine kinase n=1 Tax=Tenacibaculum litopenaei TaxID=396016 RepID=UPI003895AC44